jgi:bifunctional DNA-binding transcriptional regulator/antitoxin component of YhaV-PrlF toxin-antitoxin module
MTVATVSTKSQITLPAAACREVGIKPHDRVLIEVSQGAIVVRAAPDFMALEGILGKALSREKEKELMARAIADRGKRRP